MQWPYSSWCSCPEPHVAVTMAPQDDGVHGHQGPEPEKELSQGERESTPKLTGNMSAPKMFPSRFFPFALQEEPRNMGNSVSCLQSQNSPLSLTLHHTHEAQVLLPAQQCLGAVGLICATGLDKNLPGATSSHCVPSHTWELTPGNTRATLLGSQNHSRKVLTARGFQVPVPGRGKHAIPFHCLHLCRSC